MCCGRCPTSAGIIGYRGWSDTLVAFDPALHVVGVRLRQSRDTREHVQDIRDDRYYLKTWNGKSWDEVARTTPQAAGIEGVSGATMTSMAMAEGIMRRLASAQAALALPPPPIAHGWREIGLVLAIAAALALAWVGHVRAPLGAARVSGVRHRVRRIPDRRSAGAIADGRVGPGRRAVAERSRARAAAGRRHRGAVGHGQAALLSASLPARRRPRAAPSRGAAALAAEPAAADWITACAGCRRGCSRWS